MIFSIVIPTFNSERFLSETLESLRSQDFDSFEVIVVDGGSTDRTLEIVSCYYDTVDVVLNGPDSGQAEALNKGFRIAQGAFLLWVNGDDLLHPKALTQINRHIRQNPTVQWFNLGTVIIDESGRIERFHSAPPWNKFINSRYRPQVSSPTTVFHRLLLEKAGFFDERFHYAMDVDMWRRFVEVEAHWMRISMFAFFFRRHEASKTNSGVIASKPQQFREAVLMQEKHEFNLQSWINIFFDRGWRLITCAPTDLAAALRWSKKDCREFMKL